jgi:hypothetical protein
VTVALILSTTGRGVGVKVSVGVGVKVIVKVGLGSNVSVGEMEVSVSAATMLVEELAITGVSEAEGPVPARLQDKLVRMNRTMNRRLLFFTP